MIQCCMRALCASMFMWTWQHQIGVERQSVVALAIDIIYALLVRKENGNLC